MMQERFSPARLGPRRGGIMLERWNGSSRVDCNGRRGPAVAVPVFEFSVLSLMGALFALGERARGQGWRTT